MLQESLVISAPVGDPVRGARNLRPDVIAIQTLLNEFLATRDTLAVDGRCGPHTIAAIKWFQKEVVKLNRPDGLVEPYGKTLRTLHDPVTRSQWIPSRPPANPRSRMSRYDLRTNACCRTTLRNHIIQREGRRNRFYRDSQGLVTIGVGHIVDRAGHILTRVDVLSRTRGLRLADPRTGRLATEDAIVQDWEGVKKARAARGTLVLGNATMDQLLDSDVRDFVDTLYQRRPFMHMIDDWITMALVDARFNPARVALYGESNDIPRMWNALNPEHRDHDLDVALAAFEAIWRGRGTGTYQERHAIRVRWFRHGIERMRNS